MIGRLAKGTFSSYLVRKENLRLVQKDNGWRVFLFLIPAKP